MKLSSRKELLNEAEDVLRQIRNENKQNLNEGFLYNIWSKIVDKIDHISHNDPPNPEDLITPAVFLGGFVSSLIIVGQTWVIPVLLAALGAALGIGPLDNLLRKYFQSRYLDKNLKPIIDELIPIFAKDAPINAHIANIRRINKEISDIQTQYGSIKGRRGAPEARKALDKKQYELRDELSGLEKKIRDRFTLVMRKTGMDKKFMASMPDQDTFAGSSSPKGYKEDVRDAVIKAIEPTSSELQSIKSDVKQKGRRISNKN